MPKLTDDEITEFLAEPGHLARIATVDDDGMPRVLPLWYVVDGGRLCFTPRQPAVIWRNIERDRRVGITIDEEAAPYRKVVLQGVVEIVHPPKDEPFGRRLVIRDVAGNTLYLLQPPAGS